MLNKILKYSKVNKNGMSYFDQKKYIKSDCSILFDEYDNNDFNNDYINSLHIKNLILERGCNAKIRFTNAKNIFIENEKNLGGITIPYEYMLNKKPYFEFLWNKEHPSNINKINIIHEDKVKIINIKNVEKIIVTIVGYTLKLAIENNNSSIEYSIDELGQERTKKVSYEIYESDIKNNSLNLSNYLDYELIYYNNFNTLKVDTLVIDKECLKNLYKIKSAFTYINFNNLKIIDNNEMKLFPQILNINKEDINTINVLDDGNRNYYINVVGHDRKIIYLNKEENIKVYSKNDLMFDKRVEEVKFYLEDIFKRGINYPLILIKYKNNKHKLIMFDEEIVINKLLTEFILYNIYKYFSNRRKEINDLLINNDWITMFDKEYIDHYKLKRIYEDYLIFVNHIKKLKTIGFSYKAIRYIYENHYDNLTNTKEFNNVDNLKYQDNFNINKITNDEINAFNELGKSYIKRIRLNKK